MAPVFRRVVETRDRYGLHAYLTALENANLRKELETDLRASTKLTPGEKNYLQEVLQTGTLASEELLRMEYAPGKAGLQA
jgi:hypothetical protein